MSASAILTILVSLIAQLIPAVEKNKDLIDKIIQVLAQILPEILQTVKDLYEPVKNIVMALKGTDGITPEQWNLLDSYEKQIDDAFDQAAADEGFPAPPSSNPTQP
jgi:phage-related protein